jgi:hypothetical protein
MQHLPNEMFDINLWRIIFEYQHERKLKLGSYQGLDPSGHIKTLIVQSVVTDALELDTQIGDYTLHVHWIKVHPSVIYPKMTLDHYQTQTCPGPSPPYVFFKGKPVCPCSRERKPYITRAPAFHLDPLGYICFTGKFPARDENAVVGMISWCGDYIRLTTQLDKTSYTLKFMGIE